jgi:hypothetical protein
MPDRDGAALHLSHHAGEQSAFSSNSLTSTGQTDQVAREEN